MAGPGPGKFVQAPLPNPSPPRWERVTEPNQDSQGRGLIWKALLPRAALAPLACPGLLSHALSGLKAALRAGFGYPLCPAKKDIGHDQPALGSRQRSDGEPRREVRVFQKTSLRSPLCKEGRCENPASANECREEVRSLLPRCFSDLRDEDIFQSRSDSFE